MKTTVPRLAWVTLLAIAAGSCKDATGPIAPEPFSLSALPGTIVFLSDREFGGTPLGPSRTELYAIRPDGTHERQLTDNDVVDNISALTSAHPSGRAVLIERFVQTVPKPTVDIVSVDIDGNVVPITDNLETDNQAEWPTAARWSPDGTRILATLVTEGGLAMYDYAPDGSAHDPVFPGRSSLDYHAWWSPRGDWISFLSAPAGGYPWQCLLVRANGTDRRTIAADALCDEMVWAPDGSRVLFSSGPVSRHFSIWQANPDGSNPKRIIGAGDGVNLYRPTVSPDGQLLAFVLENALDEGDVFLARPDGSDTRPLVAAPGDDRNIVFSPDGSAIVFETDRFGPRELMVVPVTGGEPVRITFSGHNRSPLWLEER